MNRQKQLLLCEKCIHRKLDIEQGLICRLTMQRAAFEDTCSNYYSMDEERMATKQEKLMS